MTKIMLFRFLDSPLMGGEYPVIISLIITFLNLNFMSEKTFQTSNRQFGEVLSQELVRHCIPVNEFMKKCHFKNSYFFNIRRV